MKITLLQSDIIWCSPAENLHIATKNIDDAPESDLYVLPEMFTTGFCMSPSEIAEETNGQAFEWMKKTAIRKKSAIAASVAVEEAGKYYNRMYFFYPDGKYVKYDKRHLFSYSGEDKIYTAGKERVIVNYKGLRILLSICYDLRFPVFLRNRKDYDLILCVANWPSVRRHPWCTLAKARAIENQCYVAAVNRAGKDKWGDYSGDTMLIDYYGAVVAECKKDIPDTITTEIDIEQLEDFRKKFPAQNDADDFILTKI